MRRVAFELDDTTIARLGDHAAGSGAFAAGGCVVARDPGNRFIRRRERGNEVAGLLLAPDRGDGHGRCANDFEKLAPLDGWPSPRNVETRRLIRGILTHRVLSSDSLRSRTQPSYARSSRAP